MSLASFTDIPRQKTTDSEKTQKWAERCVQGYIGLSRFNKSYLSNRYLEDLYMYYAGEIEDSEYSHITSPFGKKRKDFPAKIHNYNIIKPTVDRLLGEKSKRGLNYTVVNTNPDAVNGKKLAKREFLNDVAKKYFLQELQQAGFNLDQEQPELPELTQESLDNMFTDSYVDTKSIMGQNALDYLRYELEIQDELIEGFKHYLISGMVVSHRGVNDDQVEWEIVNPLDVDGDKDPEIEFYEDGDWAAYRKLSFPSAVVDYYYDDLNNEQIERLENPRSQFSSDFITRTGATDGAFIDDQSAYQRQDRAIEVVRVYWKTRKKVGFVTRRDEFGIEEVELVEEGYEPLPEEEVEWKWVNEVWEGHRIDGDIFVRMRPYPDQRWTLDNPSKCKLPINGQKYNTMNSGSISLVMMGVPYQLSYNIYKYRLELAVAKAKDKVAQFDINMIPKKWEPEDFLYWVESTGIAWVDYDKEGITMSPQHQSVMDLTMQTIDKYVQLLQAVVMEWERLSGVNAERAGVIGEHQGKGVTEQAIYQGSLITEDLFRKYARFEQRELQAILDYAKVAFKDGKKGQFIMPNGNSAMVDIDGEDFRDSEFGVFVSNNAEDIRNLEQIKGSIQALIQNGAPLSAVTEIARSNNFADVSDKIKEIEKLEAQQQRAIQELEMKQKQAERDHELALEDREDQRTAMKIEADLEEARMDNETKKEVASINDREE